jgi:putative membrane protein
MRTYRKYVPRLPPLVKAAAALGVATLAASALQAQITPSKTEEATPANTAETLSVPAEPSVSASDVAQEFVKEATLATQTEIALAKVAENKAQKTKVKELAQKLRADHQRSYEELQAIAQAHGIATNSSQEAINRDDVDQLQKAKDADFDKEYTKLMVKNHVKSIRIFDKASTEISEPDIKHYAQNTLPALRMHLLRSEEAARFVGVDEATISSYLKDLPSEAPVVSSR